MPDTAIVDFGCVDRDPPDMPIANQRQQRLRVPVSRGVACDREGVIRASESQLRRLSRLPVNEPPGRSALRPEGTLAVG